MRHATLIRSPAQGPMSLSHGIAASRMFHMHIAYVCSVAAASVWVSWCHPCSAVGPYLITVISLYGLRALRLVSVTQREQRPSVKLMDLGALGVQIAAASPGSLRR